MERGFSATAVDHRPLAGIRVLDLSRVFSGPWATQQLGDLGAEVIKVEQPGRGDDLRRLGPPFLSSPDGDPTAESSYYLSANRNKKCITIDIATPSGQRVLRDLAAISDVVIENFKVGNLAKYGLGCDDLRTLNPALIYCSITAFGQTGPNRHRLGYDSLLQAMCGVMSVTGHPEGAPGAGPLKVGLVLSDMLAGMYAAMAIQAALYARDKSVAQGGTRIGQAIDISMFDAQLAAMSHQAMHYLISGENPSRFGNGAPSVSPSNVFACNDGHIILVAGNDTQFRKLCNVLGAPALGADARYLTNALRVTHRHELLADLGQVFGTASKSHWLKVLNEADLVAGPINTMEDVFAESQIAARGLVTSAEHASGSRVPLLTSPMRLSGTPLDIYTAPPTSGQHTREVLREHLGLTDAQIDAIVAEQVAGAAT